MNCIQSRKHFHRLHVEVKGEYDVYQLDLVDMSRFSRQNRGYKYKYIDNYELFNVIMNR